MHVLIGYGWLGCITIVVYAYFDYSSVQDENYNEELDEYVKNLLNMIWIFEIDMFDPFWLIARQENMFVWIVHTVAWNRISIG